MDIKMKKILQKITALTLSLLILMSLFSCYEEISFRDNLDKYTVNNIESKRDIIPEFRDGFNILQLTDIHWSTSTQVGTEEYGQARYIRKLIDEAQRHTKDKIDLIEITGDTFMLSNKSTVNAFIETMEEIGIPYAITWGNHDREGKYNPDWISERFSEAEHCLYAELEGDDLNGSSNYVINLDKNGKTKWQLFHLDSGASHREGAADFFLTYEYIREEQLDWLYAVHKPGVPSLAYYHIGQKDQEELFEKAKAGEKGYSAKFFELEGMGASKVEDAPSVDKAFRDNNIKGAFIGHAHNNDITITTPSGAIYGYGVKTGTELYYATIDQSELVEGENVFGSDEFLTFDEDFALVGASLVTLHSSGSFDLEHLYYNERDNGDFVKWVKY